MAAGLETELGGMEVLSTAVGGSGSALSRTLYEQFTVKTDVNFTVRLDSFVALLGYYGSTSGTKIAIAYSKSNFVTDSANVTGGRDVSGSVFPNTANGVFTTPIVIAASSTAGNTSLYAFALNAGNGIQLSAGETLTVRVYLSCGSTSAGRYAVIKNVQIKGLAPVNLPVKFKNYDVRFTIEKKVENIWTTATEVNVSHFNIQRSNNGKDFVTVGRVAAKGNSEYEFVDDIRNLEFGIRNLYYRIMSIDKDGQTSFSEIRYVEVGSRNGINVYPNPARNTVNIECSNAKELFIIDYMGQIVKKQIMNNQQSIINIQGISKGIYVVKVEMNNGEIKTQKLIVQ